MARSEATDAISTSTALSRQERKTLAECETIIRNGLHTFVEVGNALTEIRDKTLYRDPTNPKRTFADYCRERWDMSRPYAYQIIDASTVTSHLSAIADIAPLTESQCRPLTTIRTEDDDGNKVIDLKQVGDVWAEVIEQAPKGEDGKAVITAAHVKETVDWWRADDEPYEEQEEEEEEEEQDREEAENVCEHCGGDLPCGCQASNAMNIAGIAITQLEGISRDDPEREKAFTKVEKWIQSERKK